MTNQTTDTRERLRFYYRSPLVPLTLYSVACLVIPDRWNRRF